MADRDANSEMTSVNFKGGDNKMVDLRRCAIASSAAALFVCSPDSGFLESAVVTPSASAAPAIASLLPESSSSRSTSFDSSHCLIAPAPSSASVKKSRAAGKPGTSISRGDTKLISLVTGTKRGLQLVKHAKPAGSQFREILLAQQFSSCAAATALPIASLSPSLAANSLATITKLASRVDFSILRSSFGTSFNLLSLCSLVVWLQRSGNLPAETPVILSQVAFRLFIPCFLLSKVAITLSSQPAPSLIALPMMAVAQVMIGALLGKVCCQLFLEEPALQPAVEWSTSENSGVSPLAAAVAEERLQIAQRATKKQALVVAACAFNNSLTLPLVFLSGILGSSEEVNRAAGYLALYMVGWSPAMWTVGYKILTSGDEKLEDDSQREQAWWITISNWIKGIMNPPLFGVLVGILIGGTPLSHLFIGGGEELSFFDTVGALAKLRLVTGGILSPVFEAVKLLGTATLAVQTVVLATSLGASLPKPKEKLKYTKELSSLDAPEIEILEDHEAGLVKSQNALDNKAFWVISMVRLLIMPFTCVCLVTTESAMPSAQNLVLLAQLNAGTRPLAGTLANFLLRQYALSVLPLTLWMAVFLSLFGT